MSLNLLKVSALLHIPSPHRKTVPRGKIDIPMYPRLILKQPQRNTMHRRIPPSLIKEPSGPIQMVKVILIRLTPPELHIRNLKITPEMARRVPVGLQIVLWSRLFIDQPRHRVVFVYMFRVRSEEFDCLWP